MLQVTVSTFRRFWVGRRVCALVHRLLALIAKWRAAWRANARRNKLFGLWAAGKLGLTSDEAEAYAKAVVMADFEAAGGVLRKVRTDLEAKGVALSEHQIGQTMDELMEQAIAQIKAVG